jgi:hypothetical protein
LCKDNRCASSALWMREGVNKKTKGTTIPDAYLIVKRKDDRRQPQTTKRKRKGLSIAKYRVDRGHKVFYRRIDMFWDAMT